MNNHQARDLFQLQSELVDTKVDMAVSKAVDRVIEQISGLKSEMHKEIHGLTDKMHVEVHGLTNKMYVEMHGLRADMDKQFSTLGHRVTAVEATLSFIKDSQREIRSKFIEYTFKAGWLLLAVSVSYVVAHFFGFIR